jgi:uncharacterized protein (TIGR00255 family)
MILSMTGYGSSSRTTPWGSLSLELKSVNGRFLEMQFRLPEELRAAEPQLREMISARQSRGKLDCRAGYAAAADSGLRAQLNGPLLARLAELSLRVQAELPGAAPLSVAEVLAWPGMFGDEAATGEHLRQAALDMAREVVVEFAASRAREGEKLAAMLIERVARMEALLADIQPSLPQAIAAYQEKITARLREALGASDDERIRQEIALFGIKADVAEELDRLRAHLAEVRRVLGKGGPAGKRLDFLMQELNREANTLGSKSVSKELSDASLEFKLLIEQMREQVQNIE